MLWTGPLHLPSQNVIQKKIPRDQCGGRCVSGASTKQLKKLLYLSEECVDQFEHRVCIYIIIHPDVLLLLGVSALVIYLQFLWTVPHGKPKDLHCSKTAYIQVLLLFSG